jgi:hypothetical protein
MSDQYDPLVIRNILSTNGYSYDNEVYHKNFPEDWATSHKPGTGPKECGNCASFGSFGGHFFAYCVNCAEHRYNFQRGPGMYLHYTEFVNNNVPSVFDTYMKNISLEDIGDLDMNTDEFNDDIPALLELRKALQEKINGGWHIFHDDDAVDNDDDDDE